jgi:hypothetical protein
MIYLVGGCSRSGKTTLARRMLRERGVPYFSSDHLARSLGRLGLAGVSVEEDDRATTRKLELLLLNIVAAMGYDGYDYMIEGVHLGPMQIRHAIDGIKHPIVGCLLGYPEADLEAKRAALAGRERAANDWLMGFDTSVQLRFLENQREISREHRAAAERLGLPFFDGSGDIAAAVDAGFAALTAPEPRHERI